MLVLYFSIIPWTFSSQASISALDSSKSSHKHGLANSAKNIDFTKLIKNILPKIDSPVCLQRKSEAETILFKPKSGKPFAFSGKQSSITLNKGLVQLTVDAWIISQSVRESSILSPHSPTSFKAV